MTYQNITNVSVLPTNTHDSTNGSINFELSDNAAAVFELMRSRAAAILSLTLVAALIGNVMLICSIIRGCHRPMKQMSALHVLILHMCFADIAFGLFGILPQLCRTITLPNFFGPNGLCKFVSYLQVAPMYTTSYLQVAISIDRYVAVCNPLSSLMSKRKRAKILASLCWVISFTFALPQIAIFHLVEIPQANLSLCVADFGDSPLTPNGTNTPQNELIYLSWFCASVWLIPTIIISAFYTKVISAVWKSASILPSTKKRSIRSVSSSRGTTSNGPSTEATPVLYRRTRFRRGPWFASERNLDSASCRSTEGSLMLKSLRLQRDSVTSNATETSSIIPSDDLGVRGFAHRVLTFLFQNPNGSEEPSPRDVSRHRPGRRTVISRRKLQTVKLTLTIIIANFLLWTPFCLTSLIAKFWPGVVDPMIAYYILLAGNLNSCLNPWIYFCFNRKQLLAVFCGAPPVLQAYGNSKHRVNREIYGSVRTAQCLSAALALDRKTMNNASRKISYRNELSPNPNRPKQSTSGITETSAERHDNIVVDQMLTL